MSEIKGIDVSSYQGRPDWNRVKNDGVKYAILRIHQRNGIDESFEYNYSECTKNKILIGGYKFSYAMSVAEAEKEAEETLKVLSGRKLDYPLFYDLEWVNQRSLGSAMIEKITIAFLNKVQKAGYKVGIYCNVDWYENVLTDKLRKYDLWISRYPYDDTGVIQERLRPSVGNIWQYSSKGRVDGINGNVDMNVSYKDYSKTNNSDKPTGGNAMSKDWVQQVRKDAVEFAVNIANDNSHGYSQRVRSLYNITTPTSYDCSSLACTAYYYAFIKNGLTTEANYLKGHCSYTGNMLNMLNCGFEIVAKNQTAHNSMELGDLELNTTHHVAIAIDKNNIVHARSSEGTSDTIDNSGNEIRTQPWYLYSHGWTHRLRFTGKGVTYSGSTSNIPKPKKFTRTNSGTVKVSTSLNVRSAPDGAIIGQVYSGNRFDVDENQTSGKWLYVHFATIGYGYISSEYATLDPKKEPVNPPAPSESVKTVNYTVKKGDTLSSIAKSYGMTVNALVTLNKWLNPGAVIKVKQTVSTGAEWVGEVTADILNVREKPDTEAPLVSKYPKLAKGNRIRVIGGDSTWYKIAINNASTGNKDVTGYVVAKYIKKV